MKKCWEDCYSFSTLPILAFNYFCSDLAKGASINYLRLYGLMLLFISNFFFNLLIVTCFGCWNHILYCYFKVMFQTVTWSILSNKLNQKVITSFEKLITWQFRTCPQVFNEISWNPGNLYNLLKLHEFFWKFYKSIEMF